MCIARSFGALCGDEGVVGWRRGYSNVPRYVASIFLKFSARSFTAIGTLQLCVRTVHPYACASTHVLVVIETT